MSAPRLRHERYPLTTKKGRTAMPMSMASLCHELEAETADLDRLLAGLGEQGWATPTPAEGWDIRDQVGHLAFFDDQALDAIVDPDGFRARRDVLLAASDDVVERATLKHRNLRGSEVWTWLGRARQALVQAMLPLDPATRLPWYGPDMSAASSVTARIMETWAHGQDVADALDIARDPTDRLRHVAFLGVRALANSYRVRGLAVPEVPVRVELRGPNSDAWLYGPEEATDRVRGSALDFCLAVTQRRHLDDLDLELSGPVARGWLEIAQAFAGPPGPGRRPGQFQNPGRHPEP
jgi:uncharacterized protein (TIGR03084 family)